MSQVSWREKFIRFFRMNLIGFSGKEAVLQCPFCGKSKFYLDERSRFICHSFDCQVQGNLNTFLTLVVESGIQQTDPADYQPLATERKLHPEIFSIWKVYRCPITHDWAIPTYTRKGTIAQVYYYRKIEGKYRLIACPGLSHGLFGLPFLDQSNREIFLTEGPWDGMALDGLLRYQLQLPESERPIILSVPGCSVFPDGWGSFFQNRTVTICYDNDHPKNGQTPAGWAGVQRVASQLASVGATVCYLHWGNNGYDPNRPSGYDLRDWIHDSGKSAWDEIQSSIQPYPVAVEQTPPISCETWEQLLQSWREAIHFTPELEGCLAVMLASVASVPYLGEQLWLKIISPPACGKTTLCEALAASSQYVVSRSVIRGFYSGMKLGRNDTNDYSLAPKLNGKTLVTKDADTILRSECRDLILSQARDLYDGSSSKSYNNNVTREYKNLRFTWILAGTSSLRQLDRSELGQRFLDYVILEEISDDYEQEVLRRAIEQQSKNAVIHQDTIQSSIDSKLLETYRKTAGYIEYLRRNSAREVHVPQEFLSRISRLAKLTAILRGRPSDLQDEIVDRELGTRLAKQLVKLCYCLCWVYQVSEPTPKIIQLVEKVAYDTSRGISFEIIKIIQKNSYIIDEQELHQKIGCQKKTLERILIYLKRLSVLDRDDFGRWVLNCSFRKLFEEFYNDDSTKQRYQQNGYTQHIRHHFLNRT